jgi:hypothetical protein
MFSFFFDTPQVEEPVVVKKTISKTPGKMNDPDEKYKIDPGYYFKHLDPN